MDDEVGSRCRRGKDEDACKLHPISGAHDQLRDGESLDWSGVWKLLEIKEMLPSAEIEEAPVRKGSRWISRIAGKTLLDCVPLVRGGAKSLHLTAISDHDQSTHTYRWKPVEVRYCEKPAGK